MKYLALSVLVAGGTLFSSVSSFLNNTATQSQAAVPAARVVETDICVYGGTSGGVIAGYAARQLGKRALVIEPTAHLGGMSSSGLGSTDIGNKFAITGLARDFYRRMGHHYSRFEQWDFEPHVAEGLFNDYVKRGQVDVMLSHRIVDVKKEGTTITSITLESVTNPGPASYVEVKAKQFIDCSYEGDLMALAKVSYHVGREDNSVYGETLNGWQMQEGHQMPHGVDPYRIPGNPRSGLLWGINPSPMVAAGTGDRRVQAYNFRLCLSYDSLNRIPFSKPDNYDPSRYELVLRIVDKLKWKEVKNLMIINDMPNKKTDCNHKGGFSLDMIGMNWDYPEANYARRAAIWKEHEDYIKGFLFFLATDPRLPAETRTSMQKYGWPKDEFKDNGGFPHQLYVREARRMIGELVMTQDHCQAKKVEGDAVGMAAYQMDSHNCQRIVVNGEVRNEGNVEVALSKPYPISYRAVTPKRTECTNLLVPVCLSASHIAYGSIRMEPVFMVLGQSCAIAASLAIDQSRTVQELDVKAIQRKLDSDPLLDRSTPEVLADDANATAIRASYDWITVDNGSKYGSSFLMADTTKKQHPDMQFLPTIRKAGQYEVYYFCGGFRKSSKLHARLATQLPVTVTAGKKKTTQTIDLQAHVGEWVKLGTYTLPVGQQPLVTVSTKGANGFVVADAVVCRPVEVAAKQVALVKK